MTTTSESGWRPLRQAKAVVPQADTDRANEHPHMVAARPPAGWRAAAPASGLPPDLVRTRRGRDAPSGACAIAVFDLRLV
jgi:hypothetical protein